MPHTPDLATVEGPPLLRPALLLHAGLSAGQALPRMMLSDADHLVLRRTEGLVVFWYVMDMASALVQVKAAQPQATLQQVLHLHEFTAAPVRAASADADALLRPLDQDAVVLDGDQFLGVQEVSSWPATRAKPEPEPEQRQQQQRWPQHDVGYRQPPRIGAPTATRPSRSGGFHTARAGRPDELPSAPFGRGVAPLDGDFDADFDLDALLQAPATAVPPSSPPPLPSPAYFSAYPRLDAPDTVDAGQALKVVVGLGAVPQPGVTGGPLAIDLPDEVQAFVLDVQLCVDGFAAPDGLRAQLAVSRANLHAHTVSFTLVAPQLAAQEDARLTSLRVLYFHEGQVCGTAVRRIAVLAPGRAVMTAAQGNGRLWTEPDAQPAATLQLVRGLPPVDLTIVIDKPDRDASQGRYVWSLRSDLVDDLPTLPLPCELGSGSAELGGKIITEVQNAERNDMVALMMDGLGQSIRDAAPPELWPALRAVRQALLASGQDRPLNVLLLTAEPHVPWELAVLDEADILCPGAPPYLGCQVNLGRWPLGHAELPPRASVQVSHMAAVVGDYAARSGWRQLAQAVEEGQQLVQRYQALPLQADAPQIKQLLMARLGAVGRPHGAEAVHFACHGEATQDHVLNAAVILGNGAPLSPLYFARTQLGRQCAPFLFMNACQVGKAGELLASFSGFAGESLRGGFRGFLAPLWSVDDTLARDIALSFYEQAFGDAARAPRPVAAVLRELRARFSESEPHSLTRLAYIFYGHPGLTLYRQPLPQEPQP